MYANLCTIAHTTLLHFFIDTTLFHFLDTTLLHFLDTTLLHFLDTTLLHCCPPTSKTKYQFIVFSSQDSSGLEATFQKALLRNH